jgi:hypothetical protein
MQYYQKYSYRLCMFLQNKTPYGDKNLERSNIEFWNYLCKYGIVLPRFVSENIINHQAVVKPSTAPWVLNELFDYLAPREAVFSAEARNPNRYKNSEYISRELFRYRLEDQLKASTNMVNSQTAQIKALATENGDLKNTIAKLAKKEATKEVSNNYELKLEKKLAVCKDKLRMTQLDLGLAEDKNRILTAENNALKAAKSGDTKLNSAFEEIELYMALFMIALPFIFWSIRLIIHFGIYWYNYGPLIILTMDKSKNLIKIR